MLTNRFLPVAVASSMLPMANAKSTLPAVVWLAPATAMLPVPTAVAVALMLGRAELVPPATAVLPGATAVAMSRVPWTASAVLWAPMALAV